MEMMLSVFDTFSAEKKVVSFCSSFSVILENVASHYRSRFPIVLYSEIRRGCSSVG